jgi:hypothetical protein
MIDMHSFQELITTFQFHQKQFSEQRFYYSEIPFDGVEYLSNLNKLWNEAVQINYSISNKYVSFLPEDFVQNIFYYLLNYGFVAKPPPNRPHSPSTRFKVFALPPFPNDLNSFGYIVKITKKTKSPIIYLNSENNADPIHELRIMKWLSIMDFPTTFPIGFAKKNGITVLIWQMHPGLSICDKVVRCNISSSVKRAIKSEIELQFSILKDKCIKMGIQKPRWRAKDCLFYFEHDRTFQVTPIDWEKTIIDFSILVEKMLSKGHLISQDENPCE